MIRKSFGGGKGMGGGGGGRGGGGGGSMLRRVGRAVTRTGGVTGNGLQEPLSSSSTAARVSQRPNSPTYLSLSSASPFSPSNLPVSANSSVSIWPPTFPSASACDDYEWVSADGSEDDIGYGFVDDFFLGSVPSMGEVQNAVSALQQVFDNGQYSKLIKDNIAPNLDYVVADGDTTPTGFLHRVPSIGSESDWREPSLHMCSSRMMHPHGSERVYDAFHLLQTEPSVQKMVVSISSDKAVWDAVLNNEVVREIRESYYADGNSSSQSSDGEDSNAAMNVAKWILDSTKAKVVEVFEKISKLVNELLKPHNKNTTAQVTDPIEEKLRTSFLLSIMVLLIVVVTRAHRA